VGGPAPLEWGKTVTRTEVTYGQLDKVLRSLGFSCRLVKGKPAARHYEHEATGAFITVPPLPARARVLEHHLVTAQVTLDGFGIADPTVFAAKLHKTA
jgi:hypothetical protein